MPIDMLHLNMGPILLLDFNSEFAVRLKTSNISESSSLKEESSSNRGFAIAALI